MGASGFKQFCRRMLGSLAGGACGVSAELSRAGRMLALAAAVGLFLYALFLPTFWIILILFLLFLAVVALFAA